MTVQRLWVTPTIFKIANVGKDVTSSNPSDLMIDASTYSYHGVFLSGTIQGSSFVNNGSTRTYTLMFGRTYSTIPFTWVGIPDVHSTGYAAVNYEFSYWSGDYLLFLYSVKNDRIDFYIEYVGSTFDHNFNVRYYVMEG